MSFFYELSFSCVVTMTHLDSTTASPLALNLLLWRVYMTHHQSKNSKDKVDSPLPYQHCMCWSPFTTPDWLCPSEPLSQQHQHCCLIPHSQASSKYWNAFPYHQLDLPRACSALCYPIQITISYPLFWLQTQNRLKGDGRFSCVLWCSALLHPLYEMGDSLAILIRGPKGHNVLPALLYRALQDQLWSFCFWGFLSTAAFS